MKQKFDVIESSCVPLPLENVDTDQIIPARFLKATTRDEKFFGDNLFRDWRFDPQGQPRKDFVLNTPDFSAAPSEVSTRYSSQVRTSVPAPAASMPPGPSPAMDSGL